MPDQPPARPLHSADYFGDQRDFWWNADYLALVARRLAFERVRDVLDLGCGIGHWGRALLPHLPPSARITGIDAEPEWVKKSTAIAATRGVASRVNYLHGRAEQIPFPETSFDLVTCQTLLIHVRDPVAVLREMLRVLRPGGLLLAVEPSNIASALGISSFNAAWPINDRLRIARFQAICERGKAALGEGDNSVGDLVPGMMQEAGATDIRVWQNERAFPLLPPYESPDQQADAKQVLEFAERDFWGWNKPDTHRYFIAGGGEESEFETLWRFGVTANRAEAAEITARRYHRAGGTIIYLIAGRKPPAAA
ncbi:MAG: class I SAM-dependent methyltransferase [Phycisphaerales bacterium]